MKHAYMGILGMREKKKKRRKGKKKKKKRNEKIFFQFGFVPEYFRRNQ